MRIEDSSSSRKDDGSAGQIHDSNVGNGGEQSRTTQLAVRIIDGRTYRVVNLGDRRISLAADVKDANKRIHDGDPTGRGKILRRRR